MRYGTHKTCRIRISAPCGLHLRPLSTDVIDPDPSPDPMVRNFWDAIDKADILPEHLTEDVPEDSMDSDYSNIHWEALKCLPDKFSTTSHYRYVLATLRREKERLLEQIETDHGMVAAMDTTLDALRPFSVDKGKGRDRG